MTYSLFNFYRNIFDFRFDVILICRVEKKNFKVCVCLPARLHVRARGQVYEITRLLHWNKKTLKN